MTLLDVRPQPLEVTRLFSRWATIGCCLAMAGIGALWAVFGPAIPRLQLEFGITETTAGLPLAVLALGSVLGALAVPVLVRRGGYRRVFAGAFAALAAGSVVMGVVPVWSALVIGAALAGLGFGCCDTLVSQAFIVGHGRRGAAMVTVAHGCFGLGTVLAPTVLAVAGTEHWPAVFVAVAVLMVAAATGLAGISTTSTLPGAATELPVTRTSRSGVWVIAGFLLLFITHFGVQSGLGTWEPTRLMEQGSGEWEATLATSGYWLAMVLGRLAAIPFTARFSPASIVTFSCGGMAIALVIATAVPGSTVWAYLLVGLTIGPIFPTGLTWLMTSGQARGGTFSYVVASALAGSIVLPPALGALVGSYGTDVVAPTALVVSLVAVAAAVAITMLLRRLRADHRLFDA